jgi:hypothetical protein
VAQAGGVKTLVLSHFVPAEDSSLTDQMWLDAARKTYKGQIIVGKERVASAALSLFRGRDADYGPAFALALLDDPGEAQKIAGELEKRYPEDTCVLFSYLPVR